MRRFIKALTEDPDCFANTYYRLDNKAVLFVGDCEANGIWWSYNEKAGGDVRTHAEMLRKLLKGQAVFDTIGSPNIKRLSVPDMTGAILLPGAIGEEPGSAADDGSFTEVETDNVYVSYWCASGQALKPHVDELLGIILRQHPTDGRVYLDVSDDNGIAEPDRFKVSPYPL